jgi:hypothetical protein
VCEGEIEKKDERREKREERSAWVHVNHGGRMKRRWVRVTARVVIRGVIRVVVREADEKEGGGGRETRADGNGRRQKEAEGNGRGREGTEAVRKRYGSPPHTRCSGIALQCTVCPT